MLVTSTSWAKTKTLTATATDSSNNITMGYNTSDMTSVSNTTYNNKRIYNITGDVYSAKTIVIYAKDSSGNLGNKSVTIDKIDNTKPTITNIAKAKQTSGNLTTEKLTVTANDKNTILNAERFRSEKIYYKNHQYCT